MTVEGSSILFVQSGQPCFFQHLSSRCPCFLQKGQYRSSLETTPLPPPLHLSWIYLMKERSEVFSNLLFVNEIRTQHSAIIKIFRFDNAKEYTSRVFNTYFSNHDIIHESSCAYSPQQNGVAERKHRHLLEVTRCLMLHMSVPKYLCMFLIR